MSNHLHKCPECHKLVTCEMDCTTYPNEHGARLGGPVTCRDCRGGWQAERPTSGKWWLSIAPQFRAEIGSIAKEPIACEVLNDGNHVRFEIGLQYGMHPGCNVAPAFDGALWLPRETPADPFARKP